MQSGSSTQISGLLASINTDGGVSNLFWIGPDCLSASRTQHEKYTKLSDDVTTAEESGTGEQQIKAKRARDDFVSSVASSNSAQKKVVERNLRGLMLHSRQPS
jgi:hypothetical protein